MQVGLSTARITIGERKGRETTKWEVATDKCKRGRKAEGRQFEEVREMMKNMEVSNA